jgi:hypothetical protein
MRWKDRHIARMGDMINAYKILVGKPDGKGPLGRPRRRWKYIRMDLTEIGREGVDFVHMAPSR